MATDHQPYLDLLPSYALGALDGEDLALVERHLEGGCSECEAELDQWSEQVEALASTATPVEPAATTRARVLARIERMPRSRSAAPSAADPETGARRRSNWGLWLAVAAALAAILWGAGIQRRLQGRVGELEADRRRLELEVAMALGERDEALAQVRVLVEARRIISSPNVRSVVLAGLDAAPQASGTTFVDPETSEAVFYASNLAPVPSGRTYQLWFIADGVPVSAGVFDIDAQGSATQLVRDVAAVDSIDAWAVTVEPAGGVPQPTGTMVLQG